MFSSIINCLRDPKYDFYTISGLEKKTGLPAAEIEEVVSGYPYFIRAALVRSERDEILYTLSMRKPKFREIAAYVQSVIMRA